MSKGANFYPELLRNVEGIHLWPITDLRKEVLQELVSYIQEQYAEQKFVNLNFICSHNSRRSQFAQVWAQLAAKYYHFSTVFCYSGGTMETALHPQVIDIFTKKGLSVFTLANGENPIYAIKYADCSMPIIGFSKKYNSPFNPVKNFVAILTCSEADNDCPIIFQADKRIALTYQDPKVADGTLAQEEEYASRSQEIASEMFYVFSQIKK